MEIFCPVCKQTISYLGVAPRFCQNCGGKFADEIVHAPEEKSPFEDSVTFSQEDFKTVAPLNLPREEDKTIPPSKPVERVVPSAEGEIVGPFQLVRWLGSGGMGTVWEAIETKTGRRVALKRLSRTMASHEEYVQRFVREAQLCAQISHPKVTFIYGSGNEGGQPYIAMELMPGKTLADVVEDSGPLEIDYAVDCIIDTAEGLIAAHELGLIHRDVKPSNCFVDTDDSVKIGDFGLSKSMIGTDLNLTQTGTFMGTPSYSAPEQIRGGGLDERTDIYAVGGTLFTLLTGRPPFLGDAMTVTAQIVTDEAPRVSEFNPDIPKGLDGIVAKCMAKDPADRYQTLEQLKTALIPYASKKGSIFADIGRRLAAFMIDQTIIWLAYFCTIIVVMTIITLKIQYNGTPAEEVQSKLHESGFMRQVMIGGAFTLMMVGLIYFSILEGLFGRGVGKWLMGLRLVNQEGQSPGILRSLLRSFAVPACFGLSFGFVVFIAYQYGPPRTVLDNLVDFVWSTGLSLTISAICLSTMRESNGLLGLHGMISGTKVILCQAGKLKIPIVKPKPEILELRRFGPYESRQMMGESQHGKVFLGHDELLKRDVWIVERQSGNEPEIGRINLARVTRQRWLEGGQLDDGRRWDAFEAINGIPIQQFVGMKNKADWSLYRTVMIDIVEEVREALNDGTLPEDLSLALVWLDKDGHAKLLDKHLVNVVSPMDTAIAIDMACGTSKRRDPVKSSVRLIQDLGDLFKRTTVLPASVQDFLAELRRRPRTQETIDWAHEQLQSLAKNFAGLSWDTRAGIQGATLGVEAIVYLTSSAMIFLTCYHVAPIPNRYRFFVGAVISLILPTLMGYIFRGGPVFRFMGVQVSNMRGRAASGIVAAIRALVSWLPAISLVGVLILLLIYSEIQMNKFENGYVPEAGSLEHDMTEDPSVIWGIITVFIVSSLSCLVGFVFAILSPKRGLVDFLLRTRLLPK